MMAGLSGGPGWTEAEIDPEYERRRAGERWMEPDTYDALAAKAQAIAEIIAPGIWGTWFGSSAPNASPLEPSFQVRFHRAEALSKAWLILEQLGIATIEYRTEGWLREFEKHGVVFPADLIERLQDSVTPHPD